MSSAPNVIGVYMVAMWVWLIAVVWFLCCGVCKDGGSAYVGHTLSNLVFGAFQHQANRFLVNISCQQQLFPQNTSWYLMLGHDIVTCSVQAENHFTVIMVRKLTAAEQTGWQECLMS